MKGLRYVVLIRRRRANLFDRKDDKAEKGCRSRKGVCNLTVIMGTFCPNPFVALVAEEEKLSGSFFGKLENPCRFPSGVVELLKINE